MDDTPLFGEKKKATKIIEWSILGVTVVFVLYCIATGIGLAIVQKLYEHIAFVFLIILITLLTGLAYFLYLKADQEEAKFLWILIFCLVVLWTAGAVFNIYLWKAYAFKCPVCTVPTPSPCDSCFSTYNGTANSIYFTWSNLFTANPAYFCFQSGGYCAPNYLLNITTAVCANCTDDQNIPDNLKGEIF